MPVPVVLTPVAASGTTPPTVALTGTPTPAVTTLRIEIIAPGTLGIATFRWSMDGGATWQPTIATAASVALILSGLTAAFSAGTYAADNVYRADAPGDLDGDALVTELLKFFKSFLNANAQAAWQTIAPGQQVVNGAFSWRPPLSFNDRNLPALFGYRDGQPAKQERIGDDYLIETSTLTLLYVLPWAQQETQKNRLGYLNVVSKQCIMAIERGRTPGYVVSTDPDPKALTQGTHISFSTTAWSLNIVKTATHDFKILLITTTFNWIF